MNRRATSWIGVWTKKMRPTVIAPPSMERISIGLRPYLSPRTPQMGLAIAIARPDTLPAAAVQRSRSCPCETPRSWEMKIDRNGKAKLKPKMAVNSANHSATRFRRQSTGCGGVTPCSAEQFRGSQLRAQEAGGEAIDGSSAPMRPISGLRACAARLRIYAMRALRCSALHPDLDHLVTDYLANGLHRPPRISVHSVRLPPRA